jgi:hypothetical protein
MAYNDETEVPGVELVFKRNSSFDAKQMSRTEKAFIIQWNSSFYINKGTLHRENNCDLMEWLEREIVKIEILRS